MNSSWHTAIVALSLLAALAGGTGALVHAPRLQLADVEQKASWQLLASASLGLAIWLTVMLALLARALPVPVGFDAFCLLGAFVAAQVVGVIAFQFASANPSALRLAVGMIGVAAGLLFVQDFGARSLAFTPAAATPASWQVLRLLCVALASLTLLAFLRRAEHPEAASTPRLALGSAAIGTGILAVTYSALGGLEIAASAHAAAGSLDTTALALATLGGAFALTGVGLFASRVDLVTFVEGRAALAGLNDAHSKLEKRAHAIAQAQNAELAEAQAELAIEKRIAEATLDAMIEAVFRVNKLGLIRYANPAAVELAGVPLLSLEARRIDEVMRIQDERSANTLNALTHFPVEGACCVALRDLMLIRLNNQRVSVEVRISPYRADESGEGGKVYVIRDTTVERNSRRTLLWQAEHDALTGLMNRRAFEAAVKVQLANADTQAAALAFLDLDRFKAVNDQLGHQAGDALLVGIAQALRERLRERDQLARLGGDEFAILLRGCPIDEAVRVMNDLLTVVQRACEPYAHVDARLGVSIGVAAVETSLTLETLVHRADTACYDAKAAGRNQVARYTDHAARPRVEGSAA